MTHIRTHHPSEELLYNEGLIERRSAQRQKLLGCVGCRWLRATQRGEDVRFYGYEVIRCTGIKSGVIYPALEALVDSGVMVRVRENIHAQREGLPPRFFYYPKIDTEVGRAFWDNLQMSDVCPLDEGALS